MWVSGSLRITGTAKKRSRFLEVTWAPLWGSGSGKFISRWAGGENKLRPLDGDGAYQRATTQKPREMEQLAHHGQNGSIGFFDILSVGLKTASAPLKPHATLIP